MAGDGEDISADLLWSTLGFSDPAVRREQADFLEHLSMQILLIDNIDHAIRRWKPQEFMNALSGVFMDLSAPDNILELSARAMTYFMDLNIDYKSALKPQTAKSIFARLKAADFSTPANKSMAEQCVKLLEKASTLQAMMKHSRDWLALVTFLTRHHPQLHHDIIPSAMAVVMAFSHIMCDQIHVDICLEALEALLSVYHPVIWKESLNALFALLDNMSHHPYFVDQPKVVLTNHDLAPQLLGHLSTLVTVIANPASARGNVMGEMLLFEHERLQIADLLVQNLTALCQLSKVTVSQVLKSNFCHILNIALTKIHRNDKEGWPVTTVFLACRLLYATLIPWVRDKYLDPPYCFSYIPDRAVLEMYASRVIPAIKAQDDSFISEAVENGFSVDWADSKGQTLMNWAAAVGSSRIVSYLLDCGADKDKGLKTSLHYAVIFNRLYIVKILLGNGAKVEVFDDTDQTVYDLVNRIAPHRKFDPHFILIQSCVESQVHLFGVHPSSPPRQHQGSFDPLVKQMPEIASSFVDQCLSIFTKTALTMTNTFIRKVALMQVHNIVSQVDAVFLRRLVAVSDVAATLALVLAQQLHSGEDKEHVLSTSLYMLDKVGKDFLSHFIRHGLHNKVAALITHRGDSTPAEVEELWELSQTREMKEGLIYLWEQWRVMRGRTHLYVWSNKIGFEFRLNNMWSYTFTKHRNAYLRGVSDDGRSFQAWRKRIFPLLERRFQKEYASLGSEPSRKWLFSFPSIGCVVAGNWEFRSAKKDACVIIPRQRRHVALMQVHNIVSQVDAVFLRRLVAVSDVAATLALVLAQQLHSGEDKEHVLSTSLYMLDKVGKDFLSHFIRHGLHNKVAALITHRGDSTPAEVEELWELSQTREMKEGLIYLWEQWRVMRGRTHLYVWSNKIGFEFRLNNMWSYTFTKHRNAYLRGVSDDGRSFQAWRKRIFPLLERRFQKEYASLGSEPSRKWLFSFPSIGCVVAGNWEFRSAKKDACVIIPRQRRHVVYLHMNGGMVVHSLIKNSVCELTNLSHSEGPLPFVDTLILTLPLLPADQPSQTSVLASFLCADHLGEVQSKSRAATAHLETVVQQLNFALTKQYRHKQSPEEGENWAEELQEALKALASLVKDELSISCYEIISSSLVPCLLSLLGSEGADSEMTKARVRFFEEAFQGKKGGATELTTKLVFALEVLEKMSCVTYDLNSQKLDTSLLSAWVLMVLEKLPEEEGEEGEDLCDCSGLALRPQHVTPMRQIEDFVAKLAVRSWYNSPRHTMTWAKLMKDGLFNRDVFTLNHGDYRYGLLYWIATNGRTHEWVNPVRAGLIRTGTDTKFSKQFPDLFSLARPHWVPERQIERLVIYIDLLLHLMPTCYVMKVLPAHRQRWRLEGSADAKTWQSVMGTAEHSALGGKFTVNPILWNDDGPGLRYLCLTVMNRGPLPFSHFDIYGTVCSVCGDEQEVNGRGAGEGGGYAAEFPPLNQRPQKRLLSSSAPSGILRLSQNTDGFFLTYNNSSDKEEDRAANAMPTVVDWDAPWMPVGSPQWMPVGSPQGMPVGSPQGMPVGSPQGMPAEAPQGMPADAENAGIRGEPQAEDQGGDVDDENEEDDDKSEEGEDDENGDGDENEEGYEGDENEDDENKGYQDDENEQGEDADYEVHFEDYADEGEVGAEAYVSEQRLMLYWQSILGPEDLEPAEQPQHPAYSELDSRDAQSGIKYRAAVNDWILWNEATELVSDFPEIIPQSSDAQTEETVPLAVPLPEGTVARLAQPESAHPKLAFVLRATSYSKKDMKPLEVTVDDRKAVIFKYIHRLVEMAAAKNPSTGLVKLLEDMKFTLCYRKARPEDDGDQSEHIAKQFQDWKRMVNAGSAAGENRDCKVSDILQLLHKLHCLAHIYPFHDSHDDHHQPLHDAKVQLHIHASAFFSQKMAEKLIKQLEEVLLLCCDCLPEWFNLFINNFQILIPLKTRIHIFRATAFGTVRSIMWSAAKQRQHMPHTVLHQNQFASLRVMLADMPRQDEQRLLEMTMHLMNNVGHRQASLEVTFEGEVAVGLGPTKEFYTVLSAMLQWHSLGMWMCHDDHSAHTPTVVVGEGEQPAGKYVQWPSGLFPAPYPPHSAALPRVVTLFRFLGIVLARCLMDYHIIDLPLSEPFLAILAHATHQRPSGRLWFEGILSRLDFATVHPTMGQLVGRLHQLYERKRSILQSHTLTLEQKEQHLKDAAMLTCSCQLEDLDLAFEYLPSSRVYGFKSAELVVNGANKKLTVHNVEEYMDGLMSFALCYGIAHQLNALKEGFDSVFPMAKLRIFSPEELRGLLCGDQTPHWTLEVLTKHINPVSGFTAHSATFKMALQALSELSGAEVKLFLLFTTGCSCLPPGGLASLSPRIAIARKVGELDSYPSASICVHYLKLPDYSSLDVLRERLRTAIRVKGFAFT